MLYEKINAIYRNTVYSRSDDTGKVFYFSSDDFDGLNKKEYSFLSSRGHTLKGYFYFYDDYKKDKLVIFEHGMFSGHRSYMKEIEKLAKRGFLVLAYDHSGCMESGGESTYGFAQSLMDLDDCINSLKANEEYKNLELNVIGHSWGGFSSLNIGALHDVKHIVAISGFISVAQVLKDNFKGILRLFYKRIYEEAKEENPKYVEFNAIDSLKKTKANVLIIHSRDDKMVSFNKNFNVLKNELEGYLNIKFLGLEGKKHNPHYTMEAIEYMEKFSKDLKNCNKKGLLETVEAKEKFIKKYDWNLMTEQDEKVWKQIFKYLEN